MNKQKGLYHNSRKIIVSSVTAAALGMLALSNPETVNADSLAGHQPKIAKKVIAAAQREVNTASDNLTQKKAAKDASHPASGPDAGAKDSDNDIAGDDTALVKVTVHYVDQDGKPIPAAPDETISGKAGDEYPEKAIPGYKLMDKSGEKFSADETEVTYTYRAKSEAADAPLLAPRETEAIDDWMPDKNLQKLVALNLKKSVSEITKADVAAMDSLSIYPVATKNKTDYQNAMSIESLEGMQYATNLKILDLSPDINSNNQFFQNPMVHGALNDISALKDLQKLNNVKVQMCNISDISALGNKPNLVNLSISYNHIMDFSPLKTDPVLYPSVQAYYQSVALPVKQIPQGTSKYTSGPYEFFDADGSRIPIRVADTDDFDHDHYVKFYLSTQPGTPSADGKFVEWDMSKFTAGDRGYMTVNYRGKLFGSAGYPSGGWYIIPFEIVNGLSVTAHYKDTAGNMIAPDETITGVSGDNYPDKDIKGYTLKSKSSEKFTSTETEVTYVYAKDIIPGKDVTVHYRDTDGNTIAPDKVLSGNIDDPIPDAQLNITGYTFKEVHGSATGKFTDAAQEVTYVYTKNPTNPTNPINPTNPSVPGIPGNNQPGSNVPINTGNNQPGSSNPEITDKIQKVVLMHNAYMYNEAGQRTNAVTLKAGSVLDVYGNKKINDRLFYVLVDHGDNKKKYYVATDNVEATKRSLKHNAFIYNRYGKRVKHSKVLKKGQLVDTYGDPIKIRGHKYYIVAHNRFVKVANFPAATAKAKKLIQGANEGNSVNLIEKNIMHNAYLYNKQGKRDNGVIIAAGSKVKTTGKDKINGKTYYALPDGLYIAAGNIDGKKLRLKHNAYIYNQYGNRHGRKVLKKRRSVRTYGSAVSIKHKQYYIVALNRYVKKANFK